VKNPFHEMRTVVNEKTGAYCRVPVGKPLVEGYRELDALDDYHAIYPPKETKPAPRPRGRRVVIRDGGAKYIPGNAPLPPGWREVVTSESLSIAVEHGKNTARTEAEWLFRRFTVTRDKPARRRRFLLRDFIQKHRSTLSFPTLVKAVDVGWEGDSGHYIARDVLPALKADWNKKTPRKYVLLGADTAEDGPQKGGARKRKEKTHVRVRTPDGHYYVVPKDMISEMPVGDAVVQGPKPFEWFLANRAPITREKRISSGREAIHEGRACEPETEVVDGQTMYWNGGQNYAEKDWDPETAY